MRKAKVLFISGIPLGVEWFESAILAVDDRKIIIKFFDILESNKL
jgi:hypothetical protein